MYKRMLRSALAVVFSATVAYGALGNGGVGSGGTGAAEAIVQSDSGSHNAAGELDTGWHTAPADGASA